MNKASYTRNAATAAPIAVVVPNRTAATTTASRNTDDAFGTPMPSCRTQTRPATAATSTMTAVVPRAACRTG